MDATVFIVIPLVIVSYQWKMLDHRYTALYSFSLLLTLLTSVYLFCRYGFFEPASISSIVHFYASPLLLITSSFLIIHQAVRGGLEIQSTLSSILQQGLIKKYDSYFLGSISYITISLAIFFGITSYENAYGVLFDHSYSFTIAMPLWQMIYTVPITLLIRILRLKKMSIGFGIVWILPILIFCFIRPFF